MQSQSIYNAVETERRMETNLSKLTRIGADEFVTRKPVEDKHKPTVLTETRYPDRPVQFRQDYDELPKIKEKPPFYTSLPRDKELRTYDDRPYITHAHP